MDTAPNLRQTMDDVTKLKQSMNTYTEPRLPMDTVANLSQFSDRDNLLIQKKMEKSFLMRRGYS